MTAAAEFFGDLGDVDAASRAEETRLVPLSFSRMVTLTWWPSSFPAREAMSSVSFSVTPRVRIMSRVTTAATISPLWKVRRPE